MPTNRRCKHCWHFGSVSFERDTTEYFDDGGTGHLNDVDDAVYAVKDALECAIEFCCLCHTHRKQK